MIPAGLLRSMEYAMPDCGEIQKKLRTEVRSFTVGSDCAVNLTRAQTPGTNIYMARSTVDNSSDTLHIGLPRTIGTSVGMGNLNAKGHALIAKLALSHPLHLLAVNHFSVCPNRHNWYTNR